MQYCCCCIVLFAFAFLIRNRRISIWVCVEFKGNLGTNKSLWILQRLFTYSHISPRTLFEDSAVGENMFCLNMKNKYANWANWVNSIPCTLGIFAEQRERRRRRLCRYVWVRVCVVWTLAAAIIAVSSECKQRNWVSATNYNSPLFLSSSHTHTHIHTLRGTVCVSANLLGSCSCLPQDVCIRMQRAGLLDKRFAHLSNIELPLMHMRCTHSWQLTFFDRFSILNCRLVHGQDDLWLCHPAVTAVCCVRWFHLWPGKCGSDVYLWLSACLPARLTSACPSTPVCACVCVRVEIRTRNRTTRKQRKIHTHRTGAAKTRRRRGRRVTGFWGMVAWFSPAPTTVADVIGIFLDLPVLSAQVERQQVKGGDFSWTRHRVGVSGAIHVAANLRAFTWAA